MIICFACSGGAFQYTHSIFFPFSLVLNDFRKYLHFVQMQLWPNRKWGMENWRRSQNANWQFFWKSLTSWAPDQLRLKIYHISLSQIHNKTKFITKWPISSWTTNVPQKTLTCLTVDKQHRIFSRISRILLRRRRLYLLYPPCARRYTYPQQKLFPFHRLSTSTIYSNLLLWGGSWKRRDLYVGVFCSRVCSGHISVQRSDNFIPFYVIKS